MSQSDFSAPIDAAISRTTSPASKACTDRWPQDIPLKVASPGLDELRWYKPVRPGGAFAYAFSRCSRSRSKPDRGMVRTQIEVLNQSGEVVMSLKAMNILRCRGAA